MFLLYYRCSFLAQTVIEIGSVLPAENSDPNDHCAAYKKKAAESYKTNWAMSHFVACPPGFAFLLLFFVLAFGPNPYM